MITEALKSRLDVSGPLPRAAARILESHVKYEPRYGVRASRTNLALFMDATLRGTRTLEYNAREWRKLNRVQDRLLTRAADTATNNRAYGPARPRVKVTSRLFLLDRFRSGSLGLEPLPKLPTLLTPICLIDRTN